MSAVRDAMWNWICYKSTMIWIHHLSNAKTLLRCREIKPASLTCMPLMIIIVYIPRHAEPDAFFGSSSSPFSPCLLGDSFFSAVRLSCWCVSRCHADFRKPSFWCDSALFEEEGLVAYKKISDKQPERHVTLTSQDSSLSLPSRRSFHLPTSLRLSFGSKSDTLASLP